MSCTTKGKLHKTSLTTSDDLGRYTHVYHAEENKRIYKTCQEYYWYMMRVWEKQHGPPQEGSSAPVIFNANDRGILEAMCPGASFGVCEDTIHVDNWAVSEDVLFHKHPEFGMCSSYMNDEDTELEFTVKEGKCDLCHTVAPGYIQFLHYMYQL